MQLPDSKLTSTIIGSAYKVDNALGTGLLINFSELVIVNESSVNTAQAKPNWANCFAL